MNDEADVRVLSNTVSRLEGEIKDSLGNVRQGQEKVSDNLDQLRESLPEKFVSRREHEEHRTQHGMRIGEVELDIAALRKDVFSEFKQRDAKADATRKLALTSFVFPILVTLTTGGFYAIVQAFNN